MTRVRIDSAELGWESGLWAQSGVRRMRVARRLICALAVIPFLVSLATAQSTSQLNGSVTDQSGASVSGVKITLTENTTGFQRGATSNASGLYQFLDALPGDYRLEARAEG